MNKDQPMDTTDKLKRLSYGFGFGIVVGDVNGLQPCKTGKVQHR